MFTEFAQGSLLWDWYHSPFGLVGFWITLVIALVIIRQRSRTGTGDLVNAVVISSALATVPLGVVQMGFGLELPDEKLITQLSIGGFAGSMIYGVPYFLRMFWASDRTKVDRNLPGPNQQGELTYLPEMRSNGSFQTERSDQLPVETAWEGPADRGSTPWELEIMTGSSTGMRFPIGGATITLGRSPENDIVIKDPTVSRKHARIFEDMGSLYIEDLDSKAGTLLDGARVDTAQIRTGAEIVFGTTSTRFTPKSRLADDLPKDETKMPRTQEQDTALLAKRDMSVHQPVCPATGTPCKLGCGGEASCIGIAARIGVEPVVPQNHHDQKHDEIRTSIGARQKMSNIWVTINDKSDRGRGYQLAIGDNNIGRGPDNVVVVDDPYASRQHAMIRVSDQQAYIFDRGSVGGITIDGVPMAGSTVQHGASILVGQTRLGVLAIQDDLKQGVSAGGPGTLLGKKESAQGVLVIQSGPDAGKSYPLKDGVNTIGRSEGVDVYLSDAEVSRLHALIRLQDGVITVHDSGSSSGTEVNGDRLGGALLNEWSSIGIGRAQLSIVKS